jgi:hypothetical protein
VHIAKTNMSRVNSQRDVGFRTIEPGGTSVTPILAVFRLVSRLLNVNTEQTIMPGKHHLRGVSDKEQRQYEHIKESAEKSGRYGGRAKEVAARTVLKEHKQKGHKKGS